MGRVKTTNTFVKKANSSILLELFLLIIILVDDRDSDCFSADDECSRDMMARKFALIED